MLESPRILTTCNRNSISYHIRMLFKIKKKGIPLVSREKKKKLTSSYFTCKAKARIPAASGADAEVPVCPTVHVFFKSVVT